MKQKSFLIIALMLLTSCTHKETETALLNETQSLEHIIDSLKNRIEETDSLISKYIIEGGELRSLNDKGVKYPNTPSNRMKEIFFLIDEKKIKLATSRIHMLIGLYPNSPQATTARNELQKIEQNEEDKRERTALRNTSNTSRSPEYYNSSTGKKQHTYMGSTKQKNDLKTIDEYAKSNPNF